MSDGELKPQARSVCFRGGRKNLMMSFQLFRPCRCFVLPVAVGVCVSFYVPHAVYFCEPRGAEVYRVDSCQAGWCVNIRVI